MANTYNTKNYAAQRRRGMWDIGEHGPFWKARRWTFPGEGGGGSYTLPTASADTLGGIKVGSGLTIQWCAFCGWHYTRRL